MGRAEARIRIRSVLVAVVTAGVLLAGCAARSDETGGARDEVRIAAASMPASMANPFRGNGPPGSLLWLSIFDGLTALDAEGELRPALAESWEAVSPTVWRFRLRPGVAYSNGRAFDADAVVELFDWLTGPAGQRTLIGSEMRTLSGVKAISPLEVEFTTRASDPILPRKLVGVMMVEPRAFVELGPDAFALKPVGTGAFVMRAWDPRRRRIVLERNPDSWRPSSVARVVIQELPNAAGRAQALLSGDVDIAPIDLEDRERLERSGFSLISASSMQVKAFTFRVEGSAPDSPVRDVRVRQALNYAVDKTAIADLLSSGVVPSGQPAPQGAFGHDPGIAPYPYDPQKARRLLAEAGYPHGFPLSISVMTDAAPGDDLVSQAVAEYWRQIGVETTLRIMTFAEYLSRLLSNQWETDVFALSWNSFQYNDVTRAMDDFSCTRRAPFFCDATITADLGRAKVLPWGPERLAAYQDLSRSFHDAAPSVFLVESRDLVAYNPRRLEQVGVRHRVPVFEAMTIVGAPR